MPSSIEEADISSPATMVLPANEVQHGFHQLQQAQDNDDFARYGVGLPRNQRVSADQQCLESEGQPHCANGLRESGCMPLLASAMDSTTYFVKKYIARPPSASAPMIMQ